MHSEQTDIALRDILHHIDLAASFIEGFRRDSFKSDIRTVYAVTRCLEIISEASRRLPDALKARHPEISWKQMQERAMFTVTTTRTSSLISFGIPLNVLCHP
ncbi:DUF86 domain-containing protein [Bradyrhizobium sp. TZ2]